MASHAGIHVWEIPWTEEPGGLQSFGLQRFGHDLVTKQRYFTYHIFFIHSSVNGHLGCFHALAIVNCYYEHNGAYIFPNERHI